MIIIIRRADPDPDLQLHGILVECFCFVFTRPLLLLVHVCTAALCIFVLRIHTYHDVTISDAHDF